MQYKTHFAGGALLTLAVIQHTDIAAPDQIVPFAVAAMIGSVAPDIDHKNSFISNRLKPFGFLVRRTTTHRGATHSPLIIFLFSLLMYYGLELAGFSSSAYAIASGFFIGAISHVLLDMLNTQGVPLLFPVPKAKRFRLARIRTGGLIEKVIFIVLTLFAFQFLLNMI
ncbi:metal-dependent hydrolase [Chryseomicrobium palamuruense]|uniref:Metal-dependent hydrolase n=1 Tax=Chryseomicrobium palamuruense TaxID=682973 RepID=A0ABV8UYI8_9BACL